MKTVVTIVGARPQFIKAAPVSMMFRRCDEIKQVVVHTGQHFDLNMSEVFFEELNLAPPDYHLEISGGGHGEMTGRMLQRLEPLLQEVQPDCVLVYGDTNSTLAGALCASKLHISTAHVEAGLRSFNRRMPEEQNRIVADHLAEWLFSPTETATNNLLHEGVERKRIHQVGDVMYDAALLFGEMARSRSDVLNRCELEPGQYVLATVHRAENTDDGKRLGAILEALASVATELPVVLPLHPRTRAAIDREGLSFPRIRFEEPVGYLDMVALESQAAAIATDSGGVQKEAYFHGVPCITLRDETEWIELVELKWNRLAPPCSSRITETILGAIGKQGISGKPYGDGRAAAAIVQLLSDNIGSNG